MSTAAALGGSVGDQIYFYVLRGRLRRRFLPGLRVAIPAACACADVAPLRFSSLSLVSGLAWAAVVMAAITWLGRTPRTSD